MKGKAVQHLIHLLKESFREIKRAYKKATEEKSPAGSALYLADNYYILEREYKNILVKLRFIKTLPSGEDGLPRVFWEAKRCAEKAAQAGGKVSFEDGDFSFSEAESFEGMLRAALLLSAAAYIKNKNEDLGNVLKALRKLSDVDFEEALYTLSAAQRILCKDSVYARSDAETKAEYRRKLHAWASAQKQTEAKAAEEILKKANAENTNVGAVLFAGKTDSKRGKCLLLSEAVLPLLLSVLTAALYKNAWLALLLYFPLWEIGRAFLLFFSGKRTRRRVIPKLTLEENLPQNAKTVIAVSTLLPKSQSTKALENHLADLWAAGGEPNVKICVLADLRSSKSRRRADDRTDIEAAKRMIDSLCKRYGEHFMLFVRPRVYSDTQSEYTGYDRKRGAITAFVRAVKGNADAFEVLYGAANDLSETRFFMALDADTDLTLGSVRTLLSAALHPLNTPVIDETRRMVTSGYGIFAPKVDTGAAQALKTGFSRLLAGTGGVSAYDERAGERYQDLFGASFFSGKGLINIDAFYSSLDTRFKAEHILSHDILEGEFLRTAFVSASQVTDAFPTDARAYFARLHRWVRGDWQNIVFLFRKPAALTGNERNPLSAVSKFKLFDNLRRAALPVIAWLLLMLSVLLPAELRGIILFCAVLSVTINELLAAVFSGLSGGAAAWSSLYYSGGMPNALRFFLQAVAALLLLPETAVTCLDAAVRALWRTFVSGKNRLEWVTAADSGASASDFRTAVRCMPSILSAVWLFLFQNPLYILLALLFLGNVLFCVYSGKPRPVRQNAKPNYRTREKLNAYAAAMWDFYKDYCNEENNFLPPDNVQETPVFRVAHRTSPTNIGLMLCCVLAARDLSFIDSGELYARLKKSFDSIVRLPRWNGNLLNWYDTKTLEPLEPRYVSTVDSGNFLCCLTALRQGLTEYVGEAQELREIIRRIDGILNSTSLSPLYNPRRNLFHIGFDTGTGKLSESYYDLLMSEARMTSYYAVADRHVPKKHWENLGRTLSKSGRYMGPVSWTGTMFEFFMPYLFLPAYPNTLSFEALCYCVHCQRARTAKIGLPWGISESGFYAFDNQQNYRYKAHGVQKLGLKRGLNDDLVLSPYSSFLALPLCRKAALQNIERLEELGLYGKYGFYEAADFTKIRTDGEPFAVVRSFMAHHVGMSMLAVLNALSDNVMQKRFMQSGRMASGKSLLEEKIPTDVHVFKTLERKETPERPNRASAETRRFDGISPASPRVQMLSNGEWTMALADCGAAVTLYRGADMTRQSADLLRNPLGVYVIFRAEDGEILSATRAPDYGSTAQYSAEFTPHSVLWHAKGKGVTLKTEAKVHSRLPASVYTVTLKNQRKQTLRGDLLFYFEPSLTAYDKEIAHPAFSKLFIEGEFDRENRILRFTRRTREKESPLYLAAGRTDGGTFFYEMQREKVLKRPFGIFSLPRARVQSNADTGLVDVCAALSVPIEAAPKGQAELSFFLLGAESAADLQAGVTEIRDAGALPKEKCAPALFSGDSLQSVLALSVLPKLFFETEKSRRQLWAIRKNSGGVEKLWQNGISGDFPILYAEIPSVESVSKISPYVSIYKRLRHSGVRTDLVLAYRETKGYTSPVSDAVRDLLGAQGLETARHGDGIHTLCLNTADEGAILTLLSSAAFLAPVGDEAPLLPPVPFVPQISVPETVKNGENRLTRSGYRVESKGNLPWCCILSNPSFGTLLSDSALGFTWAVNSRENKLTHWSNDTLRDNRSEMLLLTIDNERIDALASATAVFESHQANYHLEYKGISLAVRVFVPARGMQKQVSVTMENRSGEGKQVALSYYTEPLLGALPREARFIKAEKERDAIYLSNPYNTGVRGVSVLRAFGEGETRLQTDRAAFLSDREAVSSESAVTCAAVTKTLILPPKRMKKIRFVLAFGRTKQSAEKTALLETEPPKSSAFVEIETGDKSLDGLFNAFLPNQIINGRLFGRTGFYQCGGAYGFRDQLQDALALILTSPELALRQMYRCARAQFREGDVLHWWHILPQNRGKMRGVRTRYSDDLLWLPYVTAAYVRCTGDVSALEQKIAYLAGQELGEHESERYAEYAASEETGTLWEHCKRAAARAVRTGGHGLMLIGGGDWNDGYNTVGAKGKGESVWLTQFAAMVLKSLADLAEKIGDGAADEYREKAEALLKAVDEHAWEEDRYIRAFYDDGGKMGSASSAECQIDSLPQSFCVLSDMPNKARRETALRTALKHLVDEENGIVKLFTPAFDGGDNRAGYVTAYPMGLRENGGQYTHAAAWLCLALFRQGMADEGYRLLQLLNPLKKYENPDTAAKYKTEPYYLAGDVYAAKGHRGRGGWSLYTGSAGWFYTAVREEMLGIKSADGKLFIKPCLPKEIPQYKARVVRNNAEIAIHVRTRFPNSMTVDGKNAEFVPLDGQNHIVILQ